MNEEAMKAITNAVGLMTVVELRRVSDSVSARFSEIQSEIRDTLEVGDKVSFSIKDQTEVGTIINIARRFVTVQTKSGLRYKLVPSLITEVL